MSSQCSMPNSPPADTCPSSQTIRGKSPSASSLAGMEQHEVTNHGDQHATFSSGEEDSQVILSAVWQGGKLGVAYYEVESTQIFMMPDVTEMDDFQLMKKLSQQVVPRCVVVSSKQDERLIMAVKQSGTEDGKIESNQDLVYILPSVDFSLEMSKRRVLSLNLPGMPPHLSESERTLYLSSMVPFDNVCMISALGGLIRYLEKKRVGVELEDCDLVQVPVLALNTFSLQDLVVLDDNSYSALQIFHRETHPSVYKAGSSSATKEGLSLFGVMNRCKSQTGVALLRLWFLRPSRDLQVLQSRHDAVSYFCSQQHLDIVSSLQDCLKHVKNLPRILARMTQAQATMGDWQALYKTVYNAIYVADICRAQASQLDIFRKIVEAFTQDLHRIASLIGKIVDFDESAVQNRFVVKPGVDTELDEKKRTYNGLPDFMTRVAEAELTRLTEEIKECNVIYLPQLGYLLAIPLTEHMTANDDYAIPGLDFMFLSNGMVHYKSASTKELDSLLGDTQCDITDHETSIMHRLQNTILEHSKVLLDVVRLTAELDCLLSLASCAHEYNYCRPELTTASVLQIKSGRHPLQELCCNPFVPNTTQSGGNHSRIKVITGPNASGKSIYLKQVALVVFLAHIGSFVPAEGALIGLIDSMFTRVRTMESVSVGLSTFMIDLNQVSSAVRSATANSLVILDEFGKGTETADGLALLASCLRHWLQQENNCPHVVVSTHFHALIQQHLLPESPQLTYQTMEVLEDGEDLVFLYQLVEGSADSSHACHVAALAGLPAEIINRGHEVSRLLRKNEPVQRVDTASTKTQFIQYKAVVDRFLALDLHQDDVQAFLTDVVIPARLNDRHQTST